jgi:hypothetical protein
VRVKHCSSCGRKIPESATICSECEQWAADSVNGAGLPPEDIAPAKEPSAAPASPVAAPVPMPSSRRPIGTRELVLILIAVAAGGLIVYALPSARGTSAAVAAAPVVAPAAKRLSPSDASPAPAATQKWSSENRADWIGTQRNATAFELPAEHTVPIWMRHVRPVLVVRCVAKSTQVFVWTGSALNMEADTADHTVTFRFDDEPQITERWPDSDEHDALFAPDGAAFARRLITAQRMRIGYTPHNASSVVAHFEAGGLGGLIEASAKECGWQKNN